MIAMEVSDQAAAVRRGAGLFWLSDRGLVRVDGGDQIHWLNGMISNDVSKLETGPQRSGCYALLLTRQGRIVSDLHVLLRPDAVWLDLPRQVMRSAFECLERFIVADDVQLLESSDSVSRLGIEGNAAPAVLAKASDERMDLTLDACADCHLADVPVVVAAYGWSGAPAFQLFVPADATEDVVRVLRDAGRDMGLVMASPAVLEILRIEAGIPQVGAELDGDVLPAEANLERAVSITKGCYTGQEVVERMRSRGKLAYRLVGLRLEEQPVEAGSEVVTGAKTIGQITSSCRSAIAGPIALAFVRRAYSKPGTDVRVRGGGGARVSELPFFSVDGLVAA